MKLVDKVEMVNDEGIAFALIKIRQYDVVLYGAGREGYSALRRLIELYGITPVCIVDQDKDKRGTVVCGVKVVHPSELAEHIRDAENTYALIAVNRHLWQDDIVRTEINSVLDDAGIHKRQYITWRSNDAWKSFDDYLNTHKEDLRELEGKLADEESKSVLKEWVRCWLQADLYCLPEHPFKYKYWGCDDDGNEELYTHLKDEVFINCGSSIGDTIFWYLAKGYSFEAIHAYEGDAEIFKRLQKNIALLDEETQKKIVLHQEYMGSEKEDEGAQFAGKRVTLINADIEGAELGVLQGMENIIKEQKPVIAFCVYHKPDDIISIPKFILELNCGYHIFLRKYVHYDRNRWEVVMYAVPPQRRIRSELSYESEKH